MGYRMIIADDEEMLIELIKRLGHFETYDIQIVDECHDGEEAYESILKNRPDFVLTDIQMPSLDGLEMIEHVQHTLPDTLFVLLSGYQYFEYAQTAVRLNVVDYLLKPINEDQLNALLERLCRMTDEHRRQQFDREELRDIRDRESREKIDQFWNWMLTASATDGSDAQWKIVQPEKYGLTFSENLFRLLAIETRLSISTGTRFSFEKKLDELTESAFQNKVSYLCCHRGFRYYILINFAEENAGAMRSAVNNLYYACRELHDVFGEFRLTLGLSQIKDTFEKLPSAASEVNDAIWGRLFFVGDQQIRYEQLNGMKRMKLSEFLPEEKARLLADAVRYLKKDVMASVFSDLEKVLQRYPMMHPHDLGCAVETLIVYAVANVAEDEREKQRAALDEAVQAAWNPQQTLQSIFGTLETYMDERSLRLERANRQPVRIAVDYIQRHYNDAISLESVAEVAGVSSAYLSKLFREIQETGFNEYLTDVRMEASKHLLADTRMPVRDVASAVGYQDEKYYAKLFKKQFGIKPTDYRKLYG